MGGGEWRKGSFVLYKCFLLPPPPLFLRAGGGGEWCWSNFSTPWVVGGKELIVMWREGEMLMVFAQGKKGKKGDGLYRAFVSRWNCSLTFFFFPLLISSHYSLCSCFSWDKGGGGRRRRRGGGGERKRQSWINLLYYLLRRSWVRSTFGLLGWLRKVIWAKIAQ